MKNLFCYTSDNLSLLPTNNVKYFFEDDFTYTLSISKDDAKIDSINSILLSLSINDYCLVESEEAHSYHSFNSPYKLLINFTLEKQMKYIFGNTPFIKAFEDTLESILIDIPTSINDHYIYEVIKKKSLLITPYVANIYFKKLNSETIIISINLLVDTIFK